MKLLLLRRTVIPIAGVALMLFVVVRVPLALVDGDGITALGFFLLGFVGLWLVSLSRPAEESSASDVADPDSTATLPSDEELR
jgi:hypothetical protein